MMVERKMELEISIHALREEGDPDGLYLCFPHFVISIHALREEGDLGQSSINAPSVDFYPRPPRGGRPQRSCAAATAQYISIHALREEGDCTTAVHALDVREFLSTPSARRATGAATPGGPSGGNFYPRPPRGGRLPDGQTIQLRNDISIHALREEGDGYRGPETPDEYISIHALREEGDVLVLWYNDGVRRFLSTPSARRATRGVHQAARPSAISIHALREEGDCCRNR